MIYLLYILSDNTVQYILILKLLLLFPFDMLSFFCIEHTDDYFLDVYFLHSGLEICAHVARYGDMG